MIAVLAMRVELTLTGGRKVFMNAESVEFVKECDWCGQELRTLDPRTLRHRKCKRAAANHRQKMKPSTVS